MKKFLKVMLISAAVFLVVGLGFSIGGIAMGATLEGVHIIDEIKHQYREITREIREETWDEDLDDLKEIDSEYTAGSGDGVYVYDAIDEVDVELKYDTLMIENYSENTVRVEVKNDPEGDIRVSNEGKELKIQGGNRSEDDRTVILYLPEKTVLKKFSAEVDAGLIELTGDFTADEADIQIGAGQISNEGTLQVEDLDIKVDAGAMELYGLTADRVKGECGVGSMYLGMSGREEDYNYKLKCDLGKIIIGEKEYVSLGRNQTLDNQGAAGKMELECGMGEIAVEFEEV